MAESITNTKTGGIEDAFLSLGELREAHTSLLQRDLEILETKETEGTGARNNEFLDQVEEFINRGRATGKILDEIDKRQEAQSLLNYWITVLYRAERTPPDAVLELYDPLLEPDLDPFNCPYKGLDPFKEEDAQIFFGRQRLIQEVVAQLKEESLISIVGLSGSGKTSLVFAGVIPALKSGKPIVGGDNWRYYTPITPGAEPIQSLTLMLKHRDPELQVESDCFLRSPDYLFSLIGGHDAAPAVIVVDQFDDVFTLCKDEAQSRAFVDNLLTLRNMSKNSHKIILIMRSDHASYTLKNPELQKTFRESEVRAVPLTESELREAIERPAEQVGLKFKQGITDQIIKEIYSEPAGLPLLQFALLKLWDLKERNVITWAAYNKLGDCREALSQSASAFYNGLDDSEESVARQVLLQMVRLSEGFEVTSNRVQRSAFHRTGDDSKLIDKMLNALRDAHLVRWNKGDSPATDQFEIAHETLVRYWPKMREWLRADREAMITRQRLEYLVSEWVAQGRSSSGLLDEVRLTEAEAWLQSPDAKQVGYDEDLPRLVAASRAAIDKAKNEEKAAHQREVDQAIKLAIAEKKANRRLILLSVLLALGVLVAGAFARFAFKQLPRYTSLRLASESSLKKDTQLDLALLFSLEAIRSENTSEARGSLLAALQRGTGIITFLSNQPTRPGGANKKIVDVCFSKDEKKGGGGICCGL